MDIHTKVLTFAEVGDLRSLKSMFEEIPEEHRSSFANAAVAGRTPLIQACKNGHLTTVQFLIEECKADVEKVGAVDIFGEGIMYDAAPLWCAAAYGHFHVVKQLLLYNACINVKTRTHSTPLRAACFDGHIKVIKLLVHHGANIEIPNFAGNTCLMIASYRGHYEVVKFLLQHGANVNARSSKGNTALHEAAESNNVKIIKLLLKYGATMSDNVYGISPLLVAAHEANKDVVNFMICSNLCTLDETIDGYELLGAAFLLREQNTESALYFWQLGFYHRCKFTEMPLHKPAFRSYINNYVEAKEAQSLEELEAFAHEPDKLFIHSLVLHERILGAGHPTTALYIRRCGTLYAHTGNFKCCVKLWLCAINLQQTTLDPCHPMIVDIFLLCANLFSTSLEEQLRGTRQKPCFNFQDFMNVFQKTIEEMRRSILKTCPERELNVGLHHMMVITLSMVSLFLRGVIDYSSEEVVCVKSLLKKFLKLKPCGVGRETLLHIACRQPRVSNDPKFRSISFPNKEVAEFLLEAGASPTAVDDSGNTPLHNVALCLPSADDQLFKTLLDYGAHLDIRNIYEKTALQLLLSKKIQICTVRYLTLECLCARVIQKENINIPAWLPNVLKTFISLH